MTKPYCIIVTGRPGSGKTTLSKKLAGELHLPAISRDEVKEGYVVSTGSTHRDLPDETSWKATEAFFKATRLLLESMVSVVVEAAFQHKVWSIVIPEWIGLSRTRIVICEPEADICAKRHLERGLADPARERFHGDLRVSHFRESGEILGSSDYNPPSFDCPTLKVDTESDYNPSIENIIDWLNIEKPNQTSLTTPKATPPTS